MVFEVAQLLTYRTLADAKLVGGFADATQP
jgi:hypothetical protein